MKKRNQTFKFNREHYEFSLSNPLFRTAFSIILTSSCIEYALWVTCKDFVRFFWGFFAIWILSWRIQDTLDFPFSFPSLSACFLCLLFPQGSKTQKCKNFLFLLVQRDSCPSFLAFCLFLFTKNDSKITPSLYSLKT